MIEVIGAYPLLEQGPEAGHAVHRYPWEAFRILAAQVGSITQESITLCAVVNNNFMYFLFCRTRLILC